MPALISIVSFFVILYLLVKNPWMGVPAVVSIAALFAQHFYGKTNHDLHNLFGAILFFGAIGVVIGGVITMFINARRKGRFEINM